VPDYATTILAEPGLVGYWEQNEPSGTNAADSAASPAAGTYTNTASLAQGVTPTGITTNTPGDTAVDYARGANTAGGYVAIPAVTKTQFTTAFTLECWLRLDSNLPASAFYTLFAHLTNGASSSGNYSFYLTNPGASATNNVKLENEINSSAFSTQTSSITFTFTLGAWFHTVCMWDGSNVSFWVNGSQVGTNIAKTGTMSAFSVGCSIARYGTTGTDFWDGGINHMAIYNTAIGATAIANHYSVGTSPSTPPVYPVAQNFKTRPMKVGRRTVGAW
jgi:hypothetical protein